MKRTTVTEIAGNFGNISVQVRNSNDLLKMLCLIKILANGFLIFCIFRLLLRVFIVIQNEHYLLKTIVQTSYPGPDVPAGVLWPHLPLQPRHLGPGLRPLQDHHACHADLCGRCGPQLLSPLLDGGVWDGRGQRQLEENR